MIARLPVVALTLRSLVDRRRFWLMVLLAAVPVVIALLVRAFSEETFSARAFDQLLVRSVMPLIALVFGTAALGTELEDGTIVYLLSTPVRRQRIVLAKGVVAAGLTAALMVPAMLLVGLIASSQDSSLAGPAVGFAVAIVAGGSAYALAFLALSAFTSRALAIGLGYILLWEAILAGIFEGSRVFSIRQATLGLAAELSGVGVGVETIGGSTSMVVLVVIIVGSLAIATWRLSRYQIRGGD